VAALEVCIGTGRIAEAIADPDKTSTISDLLGEGSYYGMQTFDQHLLKHLQAGRITYEEAMRAATSPHDFKLMVAAVGPIADLSAQPESESEPETAPMQASFAPSPSSPPPPSAPPPGVTY